MSGKRESPETDARVGAEILPSRASALFTKALFSRKTLREAVETVAHEKGTIALDRPFGLPILYMPGSRQLPGRGECECPTGETFFERSFVSII